MKKFIFFIFAICMCGPSFANICGNRKVIDGNKLLFYNSILNTLGEYTECDTNNDKRLMVGCDGKIYKCNDKKWELAYIQKPCPSGWGDATSQRIKPENTIANPTDTGDIYFFTPTNTIYVLENSICTYTTDECNNDYDKCIKDGRVPVNCTICDPAAGGKNTFTKCIYVKNGEKNISDVKFLYNGFKIKTNRETSIAKYDSTNKCYSIEWHPENNDNVTVSAQGFTPVTMRVKALLNTDSIQLSTDGSANPQQNTSNTNSAFELQYNEKTNLTCTPNKNYSDTNKCKMNTQVIDINGNLQKCTSTGWKKINDEPASCTGALEELETTYRDIERDTSIYNAFHGKESEDLSWIYFYDYDDDHNCIGAIKNPCKYSFENYKKANAECEEKDGQFLSNYDNMGNIILCDTNTSVTVTDEKQQPLTSVPTGTKKAECIKSGGDDYKDDKCICNANDHLEEYNPENAKEYSICRCMDGYKRNNETNEATGKCIYAPETQTKIERDDMTMQRDAEDAYRNEYDNAQSWANKGTTALSTLATGEGAMMAARAIAEKIADNDAEREMAEYVSTMKCEYGGGQSVNLGDMETLPGGNELANYYAEYKQLADKLKATKAALNLRPGIEAEVLYDRAETGLYQYQTAERQSGGFTSLSRALMNPDGTDAEQWNAQRAETNRDLWVGGALATVGLAGSYIANRAINKDHVKKYKELEEKFMEITTKLEHEYPEIFIPTEIEPVVVEVVENPEKPNTPIVTTRLEVSTRNETFNSDTFPSGHITLSEKGKQALTKFANDIAQIQGISSVKISANGFADPDPINKNWVNSLTKEYVKEIGTLPDYYNKKIDNNDELARARAENVMNFLIKQFNTAIITAAPGSTTGRVDSKCNQYSTKTEKANCRYVNVTLEVTTETTVTEQN